MERDSPPTAVKYLEWLLAAIAAAFLGVGADHAMRGEYVLATLAAAIGVVISIVAWKWHSIKTKINNRLAASANRIATDARAWFLIIIMILIYVGRPGFSESVSEFWRASTHGASVAQTGKATKVQMQNSMHGGQKWSEAFIKLQFNKEGIDPQEISSNNVTWMKIKLNEMVEEPCSFPLSNLDSKWGTGYSGCLTHTYVNSGNCSPRWA